MTRQGEKTTISQPTHAFLQVALVYPNVYRIGMGNLGFQAVFALLNDLPGVLAERFFVPDPGLPCRFGKGEPKSEESSRPLSSFPVLAFSVPFENDYPVVPKMLMAAGIPPLARDRKAGDPLVIAGGVAVSLNPEPLSPFVDIVFIGEAFGNREGSASQLFLRLGEIFRCGGVRALRSPELTEEVRNIPGVYVPGAYTVAYHQDGSIASMTPVAGFPHRVRAVKHLTHGGALPFSVLFSPDAEFGESLLVEINRGCGRGCRFCASGWIHRPVRHAAYDRFKDQVERAIHDGHTVGLIGADLAGHPQLEEILKDIVAKGGTFSLSSIRPEGLTPLVIELLAQTGQKTATLAPEVGSLRMKRVVGKEIPSERFLELVRQLVSAGIPNVRFYFMTGLPGESEKDVEAIVDFMHEAHRVFVHASRPQGIIGRLSVQLNPFVPKPWTPFQWSAALTISRVRHHLEIVTRGLRRLPNVKVRFESPRQALIQALFSRGDRRIADIIMRAAQTEGSWWSRIGRDAGLLEWYAYRERPFEEIFPWDIVDHGISKEVLWHNLHRAKIHMGGA